jgi:uncharacterized membrane protein YccC
MRAKLARRVAGVRPALWPILQTAIAGTVAWELARLVPGHDRPLFAPIIAIVAMGISTGRRARVAVRLILGATLGIAVADVLVRLLGEGPIQLAVVLFVALALARTLSAESAFVTQAGISALLVFAVERDAQGLAPERLLDALIGGAVALVMAVLLFPIEPLAAVRRASSDVFAEIERALRDTAAALRDGDPDLAVAARARRFDEGRLDEAVRLGLDAARIAPRRRRAYREVASYADVAQRLGGIVRGTRVIAGAATRVLRARGGPAPELSDATARLADAVAALARWLEAGDHAQRERARELALAAARQAAGTPTHELGGSTIVHLVQSIAVDLLRLTGLDGADVQQRLADALAGAPPESRLPV